MYRSAGFKTAMGALIGQLVGELFDATGHIIRYRQFVQKQVLLIDNLPVSGSGNSCECRLLITFMRSQQ